MMRSSTFFPIVIALIAMPVVATRADEPSDVAPATSDHSYFRPLVTNALFTESTAQASPAMLSEPGRLRVTPASFETSVPAASTVTRANLSNDLSFLDDPQEDAPSNDEADLTVLWQLVAVLGVVILACCAVVVKKSFRHQASGDAGQLELVGTLPLSHRSVLQLVSAGESTFVVASDATGVKSVTLLPPKFSSMIDSESEPEVHHA